jgi:hypothetical protein
VTTPFYTSKIIKAGALLADTKTLLSQWDTAVTTIDNLTYARQANIFGKASRSRVEDILVIFRQRYLHDPAVAAALVALAKGQIAGESLNRILYFHAAQADALLHDAVTDLLAGLQANGRSQISSDQVQQWLKEQIAHGKMPSAWSDETIERVAQGLLSALRDFGVLQGAANKRLAPGYLPVAAFAYVAFYLHQSQPSGRLLLEHPEWQLFFLPQSGVERYFVEAQLHRLLDYHAAGSVVRVAFPAATLEEYAHVILERAHQPA